MHPTESSNFFPPFLPFNFFFIIIFNFFHSEILTRFPTPLDHYFEKICVQIQSTALKAWCKALKVWISGKLCSSPRTEMKCFPQGLEPLNDGSVLEMSHWGWARAHQSTAKPCCWCKSVQGVMTIWVKKWRMNYSLIPFYSQRATLNINQKLSQEV